MSGLSSANAVPSFSGRQCPPAVQVCRVVCFKSAARSDPPAVQVCRVVCLRSAVCSDPPAVQVSFCAQELPGGQDSLSDSSLRTAYTSESIFLRNLSVSSLDSNSNTAFVKGRVAVWTSGTCFPSLRPSGYLCSTSLSEMEGSICT